MMIRAHVISGVVFVFFSVEGESIFEYVFKVRFASFLIFGGIIFLMIGMRSVFSGQMAMSEIGADYKSDRSVREDIQSYSKKYMTRFNAANLSNDCFGSVTDIQIS